MSRPKKIFCYFIALPILLAGCAAKKNDLKTIKIAGQDVAVEIADSNQKRYQGLSGRSILPADQGMLFVFADYSRRSFVMRQMLFPLDIIWIKDNIVVGCESNLPAPPDDGSLPVSVTSPSPVNYVLEINAGWCNRHTLRYGDNVEINF